MEENPLPNTTIGSISATDNVAITRYQIIQGNEENLFAISNDGLLRVQGHLDYETSTSHAIVVQVFDAATNSATNVTTINISDVLLVTNDQQLRSLTNTKPSKIEIAGMNFTLSYPDPGAQIRLDPPPNFLSIDGRDIKSFIFFPTGSGFFWVTFVHVKADDDRSKSGVTDNFEVLKTWLCSQSGRCE